VVYLDLQQGPGFGVEGHRVGTVVARPVGVVVVLEGVGALAGNIGVKRAAEGDIQDLRATADAGLSAKYLESLLKKEGYLKLFYQILNKK